MLRLYDYLESGNGYKVRLLLHQLAIPFERVEVDIVRGATRTPGFLARFFVGERYTIADTETLVLTGARDKAIPAWATRFFMWWSGLPRYEVRVVPDAGHLLFHDHLDVSVPAVTDWLDARLHAAGGRAV